MPDQGNRRFDPLPPSVSASPADLPAPPSDAKSQADVLNPLDETPWWRPGTVEVLSALRWRWLLLAPAMVLILALPLAVIIKPQVMAGSGLLLKLWLSSIAVVISIVVWSVRRGVRNRKDPFCIHCGYSLVGLADDGSCPECGRPYRRATIDEYRKDPYFFAARHKAVKDHPQHGVFSAGRGKSPRDGTA